MKKTSSMIFVLVVLLLMTGCFGKKGGDNTADTTGVMKTNMLQETSVIPESVRVEPQTDGSRKVFWTTKKAAFGGYVLVATLIFEGRPLYGASHPELSLQPVLEHEALIPAAGAEVERKMAIVYPPEEITDQGGRGFVLP